MLPAVLLINLEGSTKNYAAWKATMIRAVRQDFEEYNDYEHRLNLLLTDSVDHTEGMQAVHEKRPPKFTRR